MAGIGLRLHCRPTRIVYLGHFKTSCFTSETIACFSVSSPFLISSITLSESSGVMPSALKAVTSIARAIIEEANMMNQALTWYGNLFSIMGVRN